jgi:FkbM family methyltransferase
VIETAMNLKAFARFLYANVPGAAAARFGAMDLAAAYFAKPEYGGVVPLSINDGLIVDVGANRGQSIAAFRKLAPRSRIVAFEPEPRSVERLSARHRADGTVAVHACALGSRAGSVTFFVPTYGRWGCDGMAATSREAATEWLADSGRMYRFDETKLTVEEHPVECRTLDSFELSPRLIKLHAQGAELDILKGAQRTIERHRPAMMCAFPGRAVTEFVHELDYRPYIYCQGRFSPGSAKPPVTFTWYLTADHARHAHRGSVRSPG